MAEVEIQTYIPEREAEPVYGRKARIGLLAIGTDLSVERDFSVMLPDGVAVYCTRMHFGTPSTIETLAALADEIPVSLKRLVPTSDLDVVVFGCTSGSTVIGTQRVEELIHSVRPGVKCTNPATASLEALKKLGAKKIAVLAPYFKEVTADVVAFFSGNGFAVTAAACLEIEDDAGISRVRSDQYAAAIRQMDLTDADAVFISCTATTAIDVIDQLEKELGIPVVTSNQATVWHSLKQTGWKDEITGFGQLLRTSW
jgi:maleate isomerase